MSLLSCARLLQNEQVFLQEILFFHSVFILIDNGIVFQGPIRVIQLPVAFRVRVYSKADVPD